MIKQFVKPNTKYGLLLSGGLDSAILFYLMLKDGLSNGFFPDIKIFTIPKHDGSELYIQDIIFFMSQQFDIAVSSTTLVGDPNAPHWEQSKTAVIEILNTHLDVDFIVLGTNQNPPVTLPGTAPNRVTQSEHPKVLLPFIDLYKTDILSVVYDENITGLINITHSCTEQKIGRCNKCWQCNERAWAFAQLNKQDTGTL